MVVTLVNHYFFHGNIFFQVYFPPSTFEEGNNNNKKRKNSIMSKPLRSELTLVRFRVSIIIQTAII